MKSRFVVIAALLFCACSPVRNDLDRYALNCKVKELSMHSESMELPYTARFNSLGQLTTLTTYDFDGEERFVQTYSYDSHNKLYEVSGVDAEGVTEERIEYEIEGLFIRECRIYGMNNQEVHRWVHENDGKHIVRTEYYSEGELDYIATKDFKGNSYVEESRKPEGELMGRAEVDFFNDENKPTRIVSDDLDVEISYNEKGLPVMSRGAVLNSLGELQWASSLDEYPCRYYSYEYDNRGNWITRYERKSPDSPDYIVIKREIVY